MDKGAQKMAVVVSGDRSVALCYKVLCDRARACMVLSVVNGATLGELLSLVSPNRDPTSFRILVTAPLRKLGYVALSRGSRGYTYHCTKKGLAFVESELSRVRAESLEVLSRVRSFIYVKPDIEDRFRSLL